MIVDDALRQLLHLVVGRFADGHLTHLHLGHAVFGSVLDEYGVGCAEAAFSAAGVV